MNTRLGLARRAATASPPRSTSSLSAQQEQFLETIGLTSEQLRVAFPHVARLLQLIKPLRLQSSAPRQDARHRYRRVTPG